MLQAIRDRATGWIAWVIIILICIPFALWGINEYFGPEGNLAVARVNDTEIGYYQYRNLVERQRQQLRQMFGGAAPIDEEVLRREALERLIGDEVLVQQAVSNGLRVGDGQLATAIRELPAFQEGGTFSQAAYDQYLRVNGTSAPGFELDMRRAMLSEQVAIALQRTAIVTLHEVDAVVRARNEQRTFRVLRVAADALEVPEPGDDAVRAWFEANPERYVQPEQVKVRYIELDRRAISARVTADDAELRAIYEERLKQGSFVTPERREARHILITVASDAPQEQVDAARGTLEALRARIEAGEDFAAVAREASQDPGSASLGGSLGTFGRGVMDPAFEEAAFGQREGELGQPVRSRFGWHLIEVTRIEPQAVRSFAEARDEVLRGYQEVQASQIFAEQAELLANLAFEHPESLETAAEVLSVSPATSGFFSRSGEGATGIAATPAVREAAFSDDVLNGGNNSELIEIGPDRLVVLRVAEREASRPRTLDEVREGIAALLRADARAAKATEIGGTILASLRGGASPEEAAAGHGLEWGEVQRITRQTTGPVREAVADLVFRMPVPEGGRPVFDGTSLEGGGYSVVAMSEVGQTAEGADDAARREVVRALEASHGRQAVSAVRQGLRERTDVEVYRQNLEPGEG